MLLIFNGLGVLLLLFAVVIIGTARGWIRPIDPLMRIFTALVHFHDRWL